MKLHPHQIPHVDALVHSLVQHRVAKDGSEMGTGKTPCACAVAFTLGLRPFVICPKSVIPAWQRWFKLAGVHGEAYNYEHIRLGKHPCVRPVVTTSAKGKPKAVGFTWHLPADALVVFDEDHRLKGEKTLNSKLLISAKQAGLRVLLVGATSFSNPLDMKALGYALDLHTLGNFWGWCMKNGCKKAFFGGMEFRGGVPVLNRIHAQIFPGRGSRMRKADIPGFPECDTFTDTIGVTDTAHIDECYRKMSRLAELDQLGAEAKTAMTEVLRMRQKVELLKVPALVEMAEDAIAQGMAPVIFVTFRDTVSAIYNSLRKSGDTISVIIGEQDQRGRQLNIDQFQQDIARACVCTYASGGPGIDLHDITGKHPRLALLGMTDDPTLFVQALGRVHRDGAKTKSTQKILFAADTVEEKVRANIEKKLTRIETLMDSDLSPFTPTQPATP